MIDLLAVKHQTPVSMAEFILTTDMWPLVSL